MPDPTARITPSTVYFGDCLDVMRRWDGEQVDLMYLQPSDIDVSILPGEDTQKNSRLEQLAQLRYVWQWDEQAAERVERLRRGAGPRRARDGGTLARAVSGWERVLGPSGMLSYLSWLGERLVECRRLLKPNGRIFLHGDSWHSHYLRLLMDAVFGPERFQAEIIWTGRFGHGLTTRCMHARITDRILFYGEPCRVKDVIGAPFDDNGMLAFYYYDKSPSGSPRDRYQLASLWREGDAGSPGSQRPWRGLDPAASGQSWSVPRTGRYAHRIEAIIPGYTSIESVQERLERLDRVGLLEWPSEEGGVPWLRRYLDKRPSDEWKGFSRWQRDEPRIAVPTSLKERAVRVASRPGDLVLDPFCGTGTTLRAARRLERRWAGIELSLMACYEYLSPFLRGGVGQVEGLPATVEEARRLMQKDRLVFEMWALLQIPEMVIRSRPLEDGGARGFLHGGFTGTVIAHVHSRADGEASWRRFLRALNEGDRPPAAGVYITLFRKDITDAMRLGVERMGMFSTRRRRRRVPRAQIWDIETWLESGRDVRRLPDVPGLKRRWPRTVSWVWET